MLLVADMVHYIKFYSDYYYFFFNLKNNNSHHLLCVVVHTVYTSIHYYNNITMVKFQ